MIAALPDVGATVFLTTQDLAEADRLADRIVVIDQGAAIAEGTPAELKARVGTDVVELRDHHDRLVTEIGTDGTAAGLRRVLGSLPREQRDLRVVVRSPSLDDVFLNLTDRKETAA
jgi:ABC-2 type transport system ATP-binding protein